MKHLLHSLPMRARVFAALLVCLLLAGQAQAAATPGRQQARLYAYNIASTLLMYYNPRYDNRDQKVQAQYRGDLTMLQDWLQNNPDPEASKMVAEMASQIRELEKQTDEVAHLRPVWLNRILELQARLDEHLDAADKGKSGFEQQLAQLEIHLAMQNLGYQVTTFGSVAFYPLGGRADMMEELDRLISAELEALNAHASTLSIRAADALDKVQSRYRFIRPRLVGHRDDWVPNLVARYCQDMLELTATLAM
mgnify:CR=1 FL=1